MKWRALVAGAALLGAGTAAEAAQQLRFVVESPRCGQVQFTFKGTSACAVNKGERMCGTADKVPKSGETFTMRWGWPQTTWKRP